MVRPAGSPTVSTATVADGCDSAGAFPRRRRAGARPLGGVSRRVGRDYCDNQNQRRGQKIDRRRGGPPDSVGFGRLDAANFAADIVLSLIYRAGFGDSVGLVATE